MPKLGMEPIRRRELIDATIKAIHVSGMNGLTMGDIARRAGVSPALAHHYFGSKDDLLIATLGHLLGEFAVEIRARLKVASGPRERVGAVIEASFGDDQFRPPVISAWLAFYMQATHDRAAARLMSVYLGRLESNLRHDLKALTAPASAPALARGLAALIDGLWLRAALPGEHVRPEEARAILYDYLARAVADPPASD